MSLQRRWQEREGKLAQLPGLEKGPIYAPLHITHQLARSNSHQSHLNRESRLTTLVTGEQGGVHIVAKLTGFSSVRSLGDAQCIIIIVAGPADCFILLDYMFCE